MIIPEAIKSVFTTQVIAVIQFDSPLLCNPCVKFSVYKGFFFKAVHRHNELKFVIVKFVNHCFVGKKKLM